MKSRLTKDEKKVWNSCQGKRNSLTLLQQTNFHDIAKRAGLVPIAMRIADQLLPFDEMAYRRAIREGQRQKNDTYCMTFYDPRDCATVTGSPAPNWLSWARVGLNIKGRATTPDHIILSATNPEHDAVRQSQKFLQAHSGQTSSPKPILSATMVVFYFGAQKRWPDPKLYYSVVEKVKGKLDKLNVTVLRPEGVQALPPDDASDIDVDNLLAGQVLREPEDRVLEDSKALRQKAKRDFIVDDRVKSDPVPPAPAPQNLVVNEPTASDAFDVEALTNLDDEEYEAARNDLLARMAKVEAIRRERKLKALYEQTPQIAKREQWPGKPVDAYITLKYADGTEHRFQNVDHRKALVSGVSQTTTRDGAQA